MCVCVREYVNEEASVRTGMNAELRWPSWSLHLFFSAVVGNGSCLWFCHQTRGKGSFAERLGSITSFLNWNYKEKGESMPWDDEVCYIGTPLWRLGGSYQKRTRPIHLAVQQGQVKKSTNQRAGIFSLTALKTWECEPCQELHSAHLDGGFLETTHLSAGEGLEDEIIFFSVQQQVLG